MTVETEKDQTIHELNADANAATSSTPADGAVLEKGESTPSDEKSATAVENDYPVTYTAEEEKRVLRKIDLRLLPIMMITWGLAYADKVPLGKVSLGQAILFSIREELGILKPGSRYSNTSMIFNIGYLVGLPVIALLIQRFPLGRSAAVICFFWGLTTICTVFCKNYAGIMVQRAALGFIEAGISPAMISIIALYWTKREQAFRTVIWVSASPACNLFFPLVNYGIASINGSLTGWRNIYYLLGSITMAWSVAVWFLMPDDIPSAKFLNEREREIAIERIRRVNGGSRSRDIDRKQIIEALRDPNVWAIGLLATCAYWPNSFLTSFSSIIIRTFGYTPFETLAVQTPKGLVGVLANLIPGYFAMKYAGYRLHIYSGAMLLIMGGALALLLAPRVKGSLACLYALHSFGAAASMAHSLNASNVNGYTKRVTASCIFFIGYSIANIVPALLFDTFEPNHPLSTMLTLHLYSAPAYHEGFGSTIAMAGVGIITAQLLRVYLRRRNQQRDKLGETDTSHGFEDVTDLKNLGMRYQL